jgi:N-formylglutamate amidohydrolase
MSVMLHSRAITLMTTVAVRLLLAVLVVIALVETTSTAAGERLVAAKAGTLPIVLTAPHGGGEAVPNVPVRQRGITGTDLHTFELAEALATHIERSVGAAPYVVAARFSRKYIDANRDETEAFDSPQAKPVYEAYHARIRAFVAQVRERFPRGGLLLDVHGQSEDPSVVHRGTRNGATVTKLLKTHGPEALVGPKSVFGVVRHRGFTVFPPNTPLGTPPEDRRYSGGFTVHTYGSGKPDGIDAIQVEVGRTLRTDAALIAALGDGIVAFYRAYLQP